MIYKTEIRDTAYGGYGVGKMLDGRIVFIPHTVTGDVVKFSITEDKTNMLYGAVEEIVEASPMRGESYCPHIGKCGGCVFGHIKYEEQLKIKSDFITTALKRNRIEHPEIEMVSADFREFRNRATFRVRNGKIGFFQFKTNDFIPVDECPVIKSSMVEKAKEIAADIDIRTYLYITENEKGEALGRTDASLKSKYSLEGLKAGEATIGRKHLGYDTRYGSFYVGFNSFLQGNRYLSKELQDFVMENAEGRLGLELYCGSGFLTLPLARKCEKIDALESYAPSIRLAERTKLKNVTWHVSPSERIGNMGKRKLDMILVDPPRTGLEKEVCSFINSSGAENLIYISCDPNTFARDVSRLSRTYKVSKIKAVDMFPGSYHVETLALLNKVK